ncbi:ATP-binding protein [Desulfosediminicola sp.]|uniref:sensor histidine kinase n=1 Tax=Desulfosediminicola sp. TaxID=2886825 RepID=UPI003AF20737
MKTVLPRIPITARLAILLLIFVLIFYGTIVHVFLHIRHMATLSEEIVRINNVVSIQSKILIEDLLEMDSNAKKFNLLNREMYREYFESARTTFDSSLLTISQLSSLGYKAPAPFVDFLEEYAEHVNVMGFASLEHPETIAWIDEDTLNGWLSLLVQLRDLNQDHISESMTVIHDRTLQATRNGMICFGIAVITAFFAVIFLSKSILIPLGQLTEGLKTLSKGDFSKRLKVTSKDEFQDLATAYNEMSLELHEQESLRSDFIATLSHEIRTPLSTIQESVSMMHDEILGKINEKQRKFLAIAESELIRITELLHHLMDVSRLDALHGQGNKEEIDLMPLVAKCAASVTSAADKNGITIDHDFASKSDIILANRKELQQVFINIISNAVKFSPQGGHIRIAILKKSKSGYVHVGVSDEGPGIAEEEIPLIFNRYYRSKIVRKHMDGMGLGLYISKKIIDALGGTIVVTNNSGNGCTFSVTLPVQ